MSPKPTFELLFGYFIFSGISGLEARAARHNTKSTPTFFFLGGDDVFLVECMSLLFPRDLGVLQGKKNHTNNGSGVQSLKGGKRTTDSINTLQIDFWRPRRQSGEKSYPWHTYSWVWPIQCAFFLRDIRAASPKVGERAMYEGVQNLCWVGAHGMFYLSIRFHTPLWLSD